MDFPSVTDAAAGAFRFPEIVELRELWASRQPLAQKRRAAHKVVIRLREQLDALFRSALFGVWLAAYRRFKDHTVPDQAGWLRGWERVNAKAKADKAYALYLCDALPALLARYNAVNGLSLFGDPVFREIVNRGLS